MNANAQEEQVSQGRRNHRVVVTRHGGPEVLQVVEEDLLEPRPGEVRVRLLAAGVSAYDLMQRRSGSLPRAPDVPYTPGEDIAGVVDRLGDGVTAVEVGQVAVGYPRGGGYTEFICVSAGDLVPVPEGVDPAQAVCLVANYLTAEMLLHPTAKVQPGGASARPRSGGPRGERPARAGQAGRIGNVRHRV